ncbi:hypothetical protein GCM10010507_38680 [Streptomyces cinnamoneus]|uniref:Uncharacterized protein n=1 Tax=Streptomyces cinnamoneus TaxID=53446 RepID=A0A918TPZ5_STRCJ|nr:hypothetical protein GCM10010507_38680 [Streptomyces cinnamoneus]
MSGQGAGRHRSTSASGCFPPEGRQMARVRESVYDLRSSIILWLESAHDALVHTVAQGGRDRRCRGDGCGAGCEWGRRRGADARSHYRHSCWTAGAARFRAGRRR